MAILRASSASESEDVIYGKHVYLRHPVMADYAAWAALRHAIQEFLQPWEPTWPIDDLTRPAFRRRMRRYGREVRDDLSYPFFVFRIADNALLGSCIVSNVRRGVTQACSLGYWIGQPFAGAGLMSDAVSAIIPFAFGKLRLHRIEAHIVQFNHPKLTDDEIAAISTIAKSLYESVSTEVKRGTDLYWAIHESMISKSKS